MKKPERMILRTEFDPFREAETILACFPDVKVGYGKIAVIPIYFKFDMVWFEPYTEVNMDYYYGSTKPLRDGELAKRCKMELEKRYDEEYKIAYRR